jgi:hypothetical protein
MSNEHIIYSLLESDNASGSNSENNSESEDDSYFDTPSNMQLVAIQQENVAEKILAFGEQTEKDFNNWCTKLIQAYSEIMQLYDDYHTFIIRKQNLPMPGHFYVDRLIIKIAVLILNLTPQKDPAHLLNPLKFMREKYKTQIEMASSEALKESIEKLHAIDKFKLMHKKIEAFNQTLNSMIEGGSLAAHYLKTDQDFSKVLSEYKNAYSFVISEKNENLEKYYGVEYKPVRFMKDLNDDGDSRNKKPSHFRKKKSCSFFRCFPCFQNDPELETDCPEDERIDINTHKHSS